jgi:hypothetical protein
MNKEAIQQIGQYILLSSELCSDLLDANRQLLREKGAMVKQAAQGTEHAPLFESKQLKATLEKAAEAGFMSTSERDQALEDLQVNPAPLLRLVEKLAEREIGKDVLGLGTPDGPSHAVSSERESDAVFRKHFLN